MKKKVMLLLISGNMSIEKELPETLHVIANFCNDKEIEKEFVIDEDDDFVINMNRGIKKKFNCNDSNIRGNHAIIHETMNCYIKKMLQSC